MTYSHGEKVSHPCRYNDGVGCDGKNLCAFCGWSPTENSRRVHALRVQEMRGEKLHVQVQKRDPRQL